MKILMCVDCTSSLFNQQFSLVFDSLLYVKSDHVDSNLYTTKQVETLVTIKALVTLESNDDLSSHFPIFFAKH